MKKSILIIVAVFTSIFSFAQDEIIMMQYNLLNYGNVTSYCTVTNNSYLDKEPYLRTLVQYIKPDIFTVNELGSSTFIHQRLLDSVMNKNSVKQYGKADYINTNGSDLVNMLYYNKAKIVYVDAQSIQNTVRDIVLYRLYYKSPNLAQDHDTAWINCIVAHLKSSNNADGRNKRDIMTDSAMKYLTEYNYKGNYMFMGDFNVYKSSEQGYKNLVEYSDVNYRFIDPINTPGKWNNNSSYASVHTQSTHSSGNGCAAGGGLDDRFDFILISKDIKEGNKHITYKANSYKAIGNDGNHFNKSINYGTNNSVPANVLDALYNHSDHLPIVLKLEIDNTVSSIGNIAANNLIVNYQNPIDGVLDLSIKSDNTGQRTIEIWSITGQLVVSKIVSGNNINTNISLENFANGMYVLKINNKDGISEYTAKIIKQ